ncbi:GCN5 family N-acetyltransferase [Sinorhizobium fredii USDA 205]|uniref:N-acetyltransferase n=1 Tax=Rhizobium fredii TaxID=380 RepID=A0A2A6LVS2_RHIFR|nr:GNAT family N-acetyltransferase [Sinorhizobium fredii]ASY67879.1 Histone acetyltransferase HPA2-related acetyltransferase [Sinorhizobium fredii CCBAU 83666]AWM23808.1 Histone acetyltransferase HPA2 and related acetyltransferase [Sinorhizobium fredii CCBAU 25509]KSV84819.1 GCN5 family N-acetyltransferase [Sinorhizobium fredii USDA 205]MCG5475616.1 GNAT family N-acetyltransferase [Sinorhizobium fredii]MQW94394.1 GNAT family N-acetyltransferase [Sinorhizobium fredii]
MAINIRDAVPDDAATILRFITELAIYEKAEQEVEATIELLTASLFGPGRVSRAVICEVDGAPAGFAIWFYNYSTWQARKGLYLEDLYVTPEHRGSGAGKMLLKHLARIAIVEGCGRFEWSVLDWNEPAIRVYEAIGAEPLSEWTRYRLVGKELEALAAS